MILYHKDVSLGLASLLTLGLAFLHFYIGAYAYLDLGL